MHLAAKFVIVRGVRSATLPRFSESAFGVPDRVTAGGSALEGTRRRGDLPSRLESCEVEPCKGAAGCVLESRSI